MAREKTIDTVHTKHRTFEIRERKNVVAKDEVYVRDDKGNCTGNFPGGRREASEWIEEKD